METKEKTVERSIRKIEDEYRYHLTPSLLEVIKTLMGEVYDQGYQDALGYKEQEESNNYDAVESFYF